MGARQRNPEPEDDDPGDPGTKVQDPILRSIGPGRDTEPSPSELFKGSYHPRLEADTGDPPAGRMTIEEARRRGPIGWLQLLRPGLVTGASDDDPSGIGTYSQVGSHFGYGFLWTSLLTFPLMAAIQELCARIALHTGVGLGVALRRKFPRPLVGACIAALFLANTINAGADLGAIAAGGSLLTRGAVHLLWFVVPAAVLILALQVFMTYAVIFKVFKWLTVALFAYVITGFLVHPDLRQVVAGGIVPHLELTSDSIAALVAILGTTISPYLFFWQASSEVDDMRAAGKVKEVARRGIRQIGAARGEGRHPHRHVLLNLIGFDPIRALYVTAIINGLVAPPLLVLIVLLGSDRGIMGKRTSGWVSRSLTWAATALMSVAAIALLATLILR